MKRGFALIAIMLTLMANPATAAAKAKEINIALWKLPLNVPAMAALEDKSYEMAFAGDYKVHYIRLPSGPKQIQAMAAGKLDIADSIGAAAVLVGRANGVDITIVGANSRAPRAFAIMTNNPEVKNIKDLKGRKVAGLRGSVVHQLYIELMEKNRLNEDDIEFFTMPLPSATSALLAKQVDAALLVGTEISRAQNGGARILADGRGYVDGLSLIAVRTVFLEENPEAVRKYLNAREKIYIKLLKTPDKFVPLVARETRISETEAKEMMGWYDFNPKITPRDIKEIEKTLKYLQKEKMIKSTPDIAALIWSRSN